MKEALNLLGRVIHQLQKERAITALYTGSKGLQGSEKIQIQFDTTDQNIAALNEAFERWQKSEQIKILNKLQFHLEQKIELSKQRSQTLEQNCTPHQAIHFYTYDRIVPLLEITVDIALFDSQNNPHNVSAYSNFIQWKERTGRERALGTLGFLNNTFSDPDYTQHLKSLITEQDTYQQIFFTLANNQQQSCFNNAISADVIERIDNIHQSINNAIEDKKLRNITAENWQSLMTDKIDMMHKVEQELVDTLVNSNNVKTDTITEHTHPNSINAQHIAFVSSLPFLSDLPESELNKLLKTAQARKYKKGQILFLEGELPTRFYIILSGWVKLYKGNADGDETIVQMLSSGDCVAESAVFLNSPYPINAQVAENLELVSLPGPTIRQLIRSNNSLAVSMLNNLSYRSQSVIQQIETTRLKSATDRVGWFLLKALLANNNNNLSKAVKLPYDKAMVAS